MKLNLIACLLWAFALVAAPAAPAWACDACGGGLNLTGWGLMPNLRQHFVGLRVERAAFRTAAPDHPTSRETYWQATLTARASLGRRWQAMAALPVARHVYALPSTPTLALSGLRDASLMLGFALVNTLDSATTTRHWLQLSAGAKLPTGRWHTTPPDGTPLPYPANFQLGTGSLDALAGLTYRIGGRRWGAQTDAQARLNTRNAEGYRFGHSLRATVAAFRIFRLANPVPQRGVPWVLQPNAGLSADLAAHDHSHGYARTRTGGHTLWATLGADLFTARLGLGLRTGLPLWVHQGQGSVAAQPQAMAHVLWFF